MNSLGSSSKWSSYDSLPSASSVLLSESDQTEDEADVFSEGEGYSGGASSLSVDKGIAIPGNYLDFPGQTRDTHSRSKCDPLKRCAGETNPPNSAPFPGAATLGASAASPGDLAFAQKCADLHRFVRPLLELLHGLKTGRFDKGLSSFQQSVAIDRLQRILGILQKPNMGERYLQNLLQIEMMLKVWFPHVAFQCTDTPKQTTTPMLLQHWHQNQLHMPVKKRKLSWSDPAPAKHRHHQHDKHGSCQAAASLHAVCTCSPGSAKRRRSPEEETQASGNSCTARQT
ncbi:circadian associated repressor of transcription a isoform X2 [Betta splendens]|uniref:Circadian associated repressor of transcription a isoform X2 n=1 Tax=Betta splendens TaxID=158456 RepID=A0A6P7P0Z0_BETSP|nr:circadian associated repressor of transcription a isoform X2 [Betta splendens]